MKNVNELKNLEDSGFNDDSVISEEEEKPKNEHLSRFLIKSHNDLSVLTSKNTIKENKKGVISNRNNSDANDSNILYINSLKNVKTSINSDDEENIDINNKINTNNNDLNKNLLNSDDDNILFTFKNKLSKLSSTEEILRDTIKISINPINKFSTSKLSRIFKYEENGQSKNYLLKSKKFGKSINKNIITYILNLYIFSEFTNLNELEKDARFKLYFIPLIKKKFRFDIEKSLGALNLKKEDSSHFENFINGINDLLNDKEYTEIQNNNNKFKKCLYITNIVLLLLIVGIILSFCLFYSFIFDQETLIKYLIIISSAIITLILIVIFALKLVEFYKYKIYKEYNNINYMLINYMRFNDYIEEWNKNYFENNKIRVSIPISLNYIMFNLDPFQNIEIIHLDMKWFIEKVYKDKNTMTKDKEFIKYFIKVRSTLFERDNIYE